MVSGAPNLRDLGGLPTADGRRVRRGVLFRSGAPEDWNALGALGITTVVDLRNPEERTTDTPGPIRIVHTPLDDIDDRAFWERWESSPAWGTPEYWGPHIAAKPERSAAALEAIAAAPGAVLFHCQGGRDRSGQTAMLVLAALGVTAEAITADYERSAPDDGCPEYLAERGTSNGTLIAETIAALPPLIDDATVARLRNRLLEG